MPVTRVGPGIAASTASRVASRADLGVASRLGAALKTSISAMNFGTPAPALAPRQGGDGEWRAPNGDALLSVRIAAQRPGEGDFRHNYALVNPRTNEFYAMPHSDITGATYNHGPNALPAGHRFSSAAATPQAMGELLAATNAAVHAAPTEPVKGNAWGGVNADVTTWRPK